MSGKKKMFQRESIGWYDLADSCKARLRVAAFMLNEKGFGADRSELSENDLCYLDSEVIDIILSVVSSLDQFQASSHLGKSE